MLFLFSFRIYDIFIVRIVGLPDSEGEQWSFLFSQPVDPLQTVNNIVWLSRLPCVSNQVTTGCHQSVWEMCSDTDQRWAGDSSNHIPFPSAAGIGSSTLPTTPQGGKKWLKDRRMDV